MGDIHQNRFVETLVVVDPTMVKNHTSEKVATYVLSVFNIVSMRCDSILRLCNSVSCKSTRY